VKGAPLQKRNRSRRVAYSARECAYLAVFLALVIGAQAVLSAVPGVELVTVMFVAYAFTLGVRRGMLAATAFSLLRQIVFGFYPLVLVLYLVYYNLLCVVFGLLGRSIKTPLKWIALVAVIACICTVCFTLLDNILTPLWYGYGKKSTLLYFRASLPFLIPQVVCTAITVPVLFFPLHKVFLLMKRNLTTH